MAPAKTVADKIVVAIRNLKDFKGSSRQAIAKYLKSEFSFDNAAQLKKGLKGAVAKGLLVQDGQRFKVPGEEYADMSPKVAIEEVIEGSGDSAAHGDLVEVSYIGNLDSGYTFDSASSFKFTLGAGDVIKGWDQGVAGMKVGSQRKLVVPSSLGYGKKGSKPDIPPDATLHFTIVLKSIA
mmetsp:Transcript_22241/g.46195  ORF Transcript_22241/g.46195 Transcript_22241/m.46195 type:complete len:180 (-) Transcript_22241:60-599(-)